MKEKLFDPARNNEQSPASGMASVNTHQPGEETPAEQVSKPNERSEEKEDQHKIKNDRSE
jgi:hypothetical protein